LIGHKPLILLGEFAARSSSSIVTASMRDEAATTALIYRIYP
jgi:hypothetical protein